MQDCPYLQTGTCHFEAIEADLDCGTMTWIRIHQEVDAIVQFQPESSTPMLKAILWQGQRRTFVGKPQVEGDPESLYYDIRDKSTRYAIRFDRGRQRWTLEGLDDSWILAPHELPRPRYFPPP